MTAVNSVINQTYSNWELIIIDDNSSDKTPKVLAKIEDPRIKIISLKTNRGAAGARNAGIKVAKGNYLSLLDSDDYYEREFLQKTFFTISKTPDSIGFMWTGLRYHGKTIHEEVWIPQKKSTPYQTFLHSLHIGTNSGITFKKEVFEKCGYFNEELPAAEDTEFFLRITKKFDYTFCPSVLINIERNSKDRLSKNLEKIAIAYNSFLPQHFDEITKNNYLKTKYYYKLMWLNYILKDKKQARHYFNLIPKQKINKRLKYWVVHLLYEFLPKKYAVKMHLYISDRRTL